MGFLLYGLGALITLIGFLMALIKLFQVKGALHGILGLLCGIYLFIWTCINLSTHKLGKALALWIIGAVLCGIGSVMSAPDLQKMVEEAQKAAEAAQQQAAPAPVQ
jgi:thiol:disulfide interchange protein